MGDRSRVLCAFMTDLAMMIDAGLPLVQALADLEQMHPELATAVKDIREKAFSKTAPVSLAKAVRAHDEWFDEFSCVMIEAGEVGGILDTALNKIVDQLRRDRQYTRRLAGLVSSTDAPVDIHRFFAEMYETKAPGIESRFPGLLRLGTLLQAIEIARSMRMLGTMLRSGVPIFDAMDVVAKAARIESFAKAITATKDAMAEGRNMAEPLGATKVFPHAVVQLIAVGEATGALDTILVRIADRYDDEVDEMFKDLGAR